MRLAPVALAALLGCSEAGPDDAVPAGGAGELAWSERWGTAGDDFARALDVDEQGNVYVAGYSDGAFDGENAGAWDAFVTRWSASGERSWSAQWGSAAADFAQGALVGADGSLFVAGYTQGNLDGQGGAGEHDAFLTGYDPSGERSWTRQWGSERDEYVYAVAGSAGAVFVTGYTEGAFAGASNAGEADVFVTHLDANGEQLWTRQWGTPETDYGQAIHADGMGNVLVAGYTAGTLGSDPSLGAEDAFLLKLDETGELVWLRQWGSATTDYGLSVSSDESGNVYVTGYTYGAVGDQASAGGEDAFLSKFDAEGGLLWTRQWGTRAADSARSVALAANGDVLVTGDTEGAFDGETPAGERDAFLVRFSPDGEQRFAKQWGSAAREFSLAVACSPAGVYVAGYSEAASLEREAMLSLWTFY